MNAMVNERAKRAAEFSPGWSEAGPWVQVPTKSEARFSGRQSYGAARGSEPVRGIADLPARYRERFCTTGSSSNFVFNSAFQAGFPIVLGLIPEGGY